MKTAGMALNVGLCNNIGKCKVKKSQLRGLGLWRRPALKSQTYGKPTQYRLVKTDTREQFIASLEVEQQGYRYFPSTIVR